VKQRHTGRNLALGSAFAFAAPAPVIAATGAATDTLSVVVSAIGLGLAILLLVEALQVRRLATGGAIAQRISLVILATICLATSALLQWVVNFLPSGLTLEQASFASRLLVVAAMGLLAAYFFSVRAAMQKFLDSMTGAELLDAVDPPTPADPPADEQAASADSSRG